MLGAVSCRVVSVADMSPVPCGTDGASACTSSCATTRPRAIARARDAGGDSVKDGSARVEPDDRAHAGDVHPDERGDLEAWRRGAEDGLPEAGGGAVEQDDAHLPGTGQLTCVAAAPGDGGAHLPEERPGLVAGHRLCPDPDPGRVHPDEAQDGGGRERRGGGRPHARPHDALDVQEIGFVRRGGGRHDRSQSHDGDRETCRHASLPSPPRLATGPAARSRVLGPCESERARAAPRCVSCAEVRAKTG